MICLISSNFKSTSKQINILVQKIEKQKNRKEETIEEKTYFKCFNNLQEGKERVSRM
jgi:hypothetical protein